MRSLGLCGLLLVSTVASAQVPRLVTAYPREFLNVAPQAGAVVIGPVELTLLGSLPQGVTNPDLRWEVDWDGQSVPDVLPTANMGRSLRVSISIPIGKFTTGNNFTVARRPRVFFGSVSVFTALNDWVIVTLAAPAAPAAPRLLSGGYFLGYGATPPGRDPALHAQKTDVAKVDVDRPPLINPGTNPTLDFSRDGLSEQGGGDAEDTSLFPRAFVIHPPNDNGNTFAYAEFNIASPTLIFHALDPSAGPSGDYNDRTRGIDGRKTDAPGEPVRIFTVIGERILTVGSPASDGKRLLFTGPLGGLQ